MFKTARNALLSLISPQECQVCYGHIGNPDAGVACDECWSKTRIFDSRHVLCSKCGAYIDDSGRASEVRCHKCDDHHYDRAVAVGVYEKALAATVISLKSTPFVPRRAVAEIVRRFADSDLERTTLIIPIPLSRRRQMERGYNQAEILGDVIARSTGIPLDSVSLARKLHSHIHRVAMDMKARELTVKNAFEVTRPRLVNGQVVLLVDDVLTSGSTSSYCAKVLKKNGASEVNVLTLARAIYG